MLKGPVMKETAKVRDLDMITNTRTNEWQPVHSPGPVSQVLV